MFPKLSQKAWDEINRMFDSERRLIVKKSKSFGAVAFMSLFDLEKYPITNDMIFEYLKGHPDFMVCGALSGNTVCNKDEWCFIDKHFRYSVCNLYEVDTTLLRIGLSLQKDKIIIIGEIHGWWEKGETQ